ncbi:hypothetical protein HRbin06_00328 [archaeon HR06]|nr:hypothetical protein HRbin06_00328 [archaeon HR06]
MLPQELLVVKVGKNWIKPKFIDLSYYDLAKDLINLFQDSLGKKKKDLLEKLKEIEDIDYKLVRGLFHILENRCEFESRGVIDPVYARSFVFPKREVLTKEEREKIIKEKAKELGLSPRELEESLWADLEEELYLKDFRPLQPEDLLSLYNLSLAQTLLFHSTNLRFTVRGGWKEILRKVKYLGLMYTAEYSEGRLYLNIEGPLSIFKMNERYGTALAKLLPYIISSDYWEIRANIVRRGKSKRLLIFELDSTKDFIRPIKEREEITYDSSLEEDFAQSFQNLGWILRREPEPLVVNGSIFIPDFSFEKGKRKVYFEIVGFWTEEYLRKKMEKLKKVKEPLIVAINEELNCSETLPNLEKVILFKKKIPVKEILNYLKALEERDIEEEVRRFEKELILDGDIIRLEDIAEREKISLEALRRIVKEKVKNCILIGNDLVSKKRMEEIKGLNFNNLNLREVYEKVKDIRALDELLNYLGYSIVWINLKEAKVIKVR